MLSLNVAAKFALLAVICSIANSLQAQGWRGPTRDGVVQGCDLPKEWPDKLAQKWSLEVGTGHSSPIVADGMIYQFSRQDDQETLRCVDMTGKEVWKQSYDAPYKMNNAARGHGKGPKSTPWVGEDRIFTLGIDGIFQCRARTDGKLLWQAGDDLPNGSPLYGAATSPLGAIGNVCLIHLGKHKQGAFVAFEAATGKVRGRWDGDGPAYASPVVMDFDGVHTDNCAALDETGREIVHVSRGDGMGLARLREAGQWRCLILSKERNAVVTRRAEKLGIPVLQACDDKRAALSGWCAETGLDAAAVLYVGNDINDAPVLGAVGIFACPCDAHPTILRAADWVLPAPGGRGALRHLCDRLLELAPCSA